MGEHAQGGRALDFGCGDGYYSGYFARKLPAMEFVGCDIAQSMIARARRTHGDLPNCTFCQSDGGVPSEKPFDVIIVTLVLAHILEQADLESLAAQFYACLRPGGRLIICEATARRTRGGKTWQRRPAGHYRELFEQAGLKTVVERPIAFPFYERVGKYLLYAIMGLFFRRDRIRANAHRWYQGLTDGVMRLGRVFDRLLPAGDCYTLMAFENTDADA